MNPSLGFSGRGRGGHQTCILSPAVERGFDFRFGYELTAVGFFYTFLNFTELPLIQRDLFVDGFGGEKRSATLAHLQLAGSVDCAGPRNRRPYLRRRSPTKVIPRRNRAFHRQHAIHILTDRIAYRLHISKR